MADFNHFPNIAAGLETVLGQAVRKTAFDLQASAAQAAPVDTGFLRNSIYVTTSTDSTYGQGGSAGKGDSYLLPPVETPDKPTTAYVGVGANYGVFLEEGTRFQPAQPYFYPAVEQAKADFEAVMAAITAKIEGLA